MDCMKKLATKWGCVPHILLQLLKRPRDEEGIKMNVVDVVAKATQEPTLVFDALANCNNSVIPGLSTVFFIKPTSKTHRTCHFVYVPTCWLISQVLDGLAHQQDNTKTAFFTAMLDHPHTQSMSHWIFEDIVHYSLTHGGSFTIHWYDQGIVQALHIPPLVTYTAQADLNYPPPFYWRPSSSKFPGIDSAIFTVDHVYVIQATIRKKQHAPEIGLMQLWNSVPQAKRALTWKLVFLGFHDDQVKAVSKPFATKLKISQQDHLPVGWLTVPFGSFVSEYLVSSDFDHGGLLNFVLSGIQT